VVDDRVAGLGKVRAEPYECPVCGHVRDSLLSVPCSKCGAQMEPLRA
jgi:hypothetical protein